MLEITISVCRLHLPQLCHSTDSQTFNLVAQFLDYPQLTLGLWNPSSAPEKSKYSVSFCIESKFKHVADTTRGRSLIVKVQTLGHTPATIGAARIDLTSLSQYANEQKTPENMYGPKRPFSRSSTAVMFDRASNAIGSLVLKLNIEDKLLLTDGLTQETPVKSTEYQMSSSNADSNHVPNSMVKIEPYSQNLVNENGRNPPNPSRVTADTVQKRLVNYLKSAQEQETPNSSFDILGNSNANMPRPQNIQTMNPNRHVHPAPNGPSNHRHSSNIPISEVALRPSIRNSNDRKLQNSSDPKIEEVRRIKFLQLFSENLKQSLHPEFGFPFADQLIKELEISAQLRQYDLETKNDSYDLSSNVHDQNDNKAGQTRIRQYSDQWFHRKDYGGRPPWYHSSKAPMQPRPATAVPRICRGLNAFDSNDRNIRQLWKRPNVQFRPGSAPGSRRRNPPSGTSLRYHNGTKVINVTPDFIDDLADKIVSSIQLPARPRTSSDAARRKTRDELLQELDLYRGGDPAGRMPSSKSQQGFVPSDPSSGPSMGQGYSSDFEPTSEVTNSHHLVKEDDIFDQVRTSRTPSHSGSVKSKKSSIDIDKPALRQSNHDDKNSIRSIHSSVRSKTPSLTIRSRRSSQSRHSPTLVLDLGAKSPPIPDEYSENISIAEEIPSEVSTAKSSIKTEETERKRRSSRSRRSSSRRSSSTIAEILEDISVGSATSGGSTIKEQIVSKPQRQKDDGLDKLSKGPFIQQLSSTKSSIEEAIEDGHIDTPAIGSTTSSRALSPVTRYLQKQGDHQDSNPHQKRREFHHRKSTMSSIHTESISSYVPSDL